MINDFLFKKENTFNTIKTIPMQSVWCHLINNYYSIRLFITNALTIYYNANVR